MRTRSVGSRFARRSVALRASMWKSSSSRRPFVNSDASSATWYSAPHGVRCSTAWARDSSTSTSRPTNSATRGRWTFTMTGSPPGSVARYACAIEAAATGCQSKSANTSSTRASSSDSTRRLTSSGSASLTLSWRLDSSATTFGGSRSDRVDMTWPSFTNMPPHSSKTCRRRWALGARRPPPSWASGCRSVPIHGPKPLRTAILVIST